MFAEMAGPESGDHKLYTVIEFAVIVSWHKESVRRAIRQGRLVAVKLGRNWRISSQTVADVLAHGIPSTGGAR